MKKVFLLFTMGIIALLMNINAAFSQLSEGGIPASFIFKSQIDNVIDARQLPSIDVEAAYLEDLNRPGPEWVGRSVPVGLNMLNSGTWTDLPDGTRIWRLELNSPGAKAIAVYYDNFYIPEGGKLFLYNKSRSQIIGAYTSKNNPASKLFSTELIQGETVCLEYIAPKTTKLKTDPNAPIKGTVNGTKIISQNTLVQTNDAPVISISEIAYVYKEVKVLEKYNPAKNTGWGESGPCEVDINCSEGTNWQVQKKGVAEIFIKNGSNYGFCTGTLTNTTNNSGIPYFLTASHCYGMPDAFLPNTPEPYASTADLAQWQFYFNYELAGCGGTVEPGYNTLTGCTLKANSGVNGGSDFTLVLLTTTPPQSYHPYYNGWDRTNTPATSGVGIHHPAGDVKKISTFTATATTSYFNGGNGLNAAANSGWDVRWVQTANGHGVTEGGSSGSPLFNQAKLQVGTLSGGLSSCTDLLNTNIYGKFWYHWDQTPGGTTTQLKTWLDPINNLTTTVSGFDPYNGYPDFYGTPITLYSGSSVNFTDLTIGATTWAWEFEGGTPATSTVQNPTNIVYNTQGTYKVKLTTNTPIAGTQSMEKVAYITVNPGIANTSIWCDNFSTPANWTLSTSGGYTDAWAIGSTAPLGYYVKDMGQISSTSGGNYAIFNSDSIGSANDNQWANITSVSGQNCSTYERVTLKFEQYYWKYYDSTLVYVSTDNFATSTKFIVNGNYANNDMSTNPEIVRLDISSAAAGKTNVKVRFTFRSTQDMSTYSGWGYAWQIDDVCLEGTAYGNSLPIPDFTATTSKKVSPGQSVSFADQSQFATSYLWTFEGGTPSTSTAQNPTNIVYNTQGYYPVTLTVTNQNGSVSTTKTDYIHVFYDCSFDSNIQDADGVTYYRATTGSVGYLPGYTNTTVTAFADKFTIGNLTGKVKSMAVGVAAAMVVGGTTNVTFTIWDNNAGVPGTVLMTKDVPVKSLEAGMVNYIDFTPTAVGSTFFAGFQLPTVASLDTFACYLASGAGGRTNTAYCKDGANWVTYQAKYGINGSLYILPEFCFDKPLTNVPDVDFFASQTEITPGSTISFTDQSTGGPAPTSWAWTLTGGSPVSSTTQNPPSVTYTNPGLYDLALNATNANGTGNRTKGGYILVANDSVIVKWTFPNTSANVTADGGATANLTKTISVCTDVVAPAFTNTGASGGVDKCASSTGWNDAVATVNDYWMAEFTTAGFTNIKLSSKQSGKTTAAPKNFAVYYSVDGGNNFTYLTAVPAISTAANWTQGVLNNVPMPAECDNQESVMILWLKKDNVSMAGGTPTVAAVTYIDDIYVVGQTCSTLPGTPGTITGPATVCQGATSQVYTVPPIANASYYTWTVPTGVTIVSGTYTNSITVDFAANAVAGSITVKGENLCGVGATSAAKAFTVTALPVAPSAITGIQTVTNGQTGVAYSVPAVSGATSYTWTVPSYATITAGATTNAITTSFNCPGGNGNMSVHANNGCGAGPESYIKAITINCPPASNFYASSTQVCAGGTVTFTDISTNNPTSWLWTFPGGTPATSTLEHPTVTYNTLGVYNVTLQVTNANGNNSSTKTTYINVGVPAQPSAITGSANPCASSTQTYSVTNVAGVTYTWSVPAGWAIVSGAGTSSISVTVGATSGTVQVTPSNTCGNGTAQTLSTTVATAVAASVSIAASANPACAGTSVTLTPTPTNGGTTPTYQWKVGASVVGTGATYVSSTLTTGNVVTCIMTSNANCVTGSPATSNAVSMTVNSAVTPSVSIALTSGSNPMCAGASTTFTATPTNGGTTPSYQWKVDGTNAGTGSTFTTTGLTNNQVVTCMLTSTANCASPTTVTSTGITMTVNPVLVPSASIALTTGVNPMCAGGSATFTVTPTNGGTTPSYQWKVAGVNAGTNATTFTTTSLTNGQSVTCIMTSNATCAAPTTATSNAVSMSVTSNVTPAVAIALTTGTNPMCAGSSATFTATPTNGGTTPTYQWKVDGVNAGTGSTYTNTALTNNQVVTCVMTSNATCVTSTTATSAGITMAVNSNITPSVAIALTSGTNPMCAGSSTTFTATPTNGGTTPTYQWKVNGANAATGSTFTTTALTNGQIVTCVMTSNATCVTSSMATSTGITMVVNSSVTPSVSTSITTGSNPSCAGSSVTFTATPTNGGTTPSYQWQVNGVNAGTGSIFASAALVNNQVVTCILTSNATCVTSTTATSVGTTMTINPVLVPTVSIAQTTGSNPMCSGASSTFTATPTNGGTPSYQWQVNGSNVGTGATYTTTALTNGQNVTCIMTSNATCASPTTATSAAITMSVNSTLVPAVSIAVTAGSNPTCSGASMTFTATPTNGGTTPSYQWKVDGSNVTTGATFTTTSLTNGQVVTCVMTSSSACASPTSVTSAGVTIAVNATLVPAVSIALTTGSNPTCSGASMTFTATPTNGGTTPSYQWKVNGSNVTTGATFTTTSLTNGQVVTCVMTSSSACASPATATSAGITVTVNPIVIPSVTTALTTGSNPMCAGSTATFTATPTNGGTPNYQWQVNGVNVGTGATYTTTGLTNGQNVTCIMTSSATCATPVTATSSVTTMTVNPVLVPSVVIALTTGTNPMCAASNAIFTATPTNGGTPTYQWKLNGTNAGVGATYSNVTLNNNDVVTCVMTSTATCAAPTIATSNAVTMTVNPVVTPSVSIALTSGSNPMCAGQSATFTATPVNGGAIPSYQWKVDGVNAGTNTSTFTSTSLTNNQVVTCVMTSTATCATVSTATSNGITIAINSVLVPAVSTAITTGSNPTCIGASVIFTATPTNGGTTPSYQWKLNGANVGTGATYTATSLINNDVVTCVMTSNSACASPTTATSSAITMGVNSVLTPSVVIALTTGSNPTCTGAPVTFTATPTNGGTIPSYQWKVDGVNVGTNSSIFTTSSLTNNQVVTCEMTSNSACASPASATSLGITIAVNPVVVPTVSIAVTTGSNPTCDGMVVSFTATPTNGGTIPNYQWKVDGVNAGTNSAIFTSTTLINNQVVTCEMISNANCVSNAIVSSNSITISVGVTLVPAVSIALTSGSTICAGLPATFTATPTNGGTTPSYQWKVDGVNAGANSAIFTTSSLTQGQVVTCEMTSSSACASPILVTSAGISATVTPSVLASVSVNLVVGSNPACAATELTFTATPANSGTAPVYQWKVDGSSAGTNSTVFTTNAITNGQVVTCEMTSSAACASPAVAVSTGITMIINPLPATPTITQSGDTLISSVAAGNQWYMGTPGAIVAGSVNQNYTVTQTNDYYVVVTDGNGCVSAPSNTIHVVIVGIEENNQLNFSIYPNPNNGKFTIQMNDELNDNSNFELFDALGNLIYSKVLTNSAKQDISLENVAYGVYTVRIRSLNSSTTQKLVIQK